MTLQRKPIAIRPASAEDNECISTLGWQTFFDSFAADNHPGDMA